MKTNTGFNAILTLSEKLETERLNRTLEDTMLDEYELNQEIKDRLQTQTYLFPDAALFQTDKQILTRVQQQFSAKKHIFQTPLYFHRHEFIEMLYVYRGSCRQYIDSLHHDILLQEGDLFLLNQNVVHALLQENQDSVLIKIIVPPAWISREFIHTLESGSPLFDFFVHAKSEQKEYYHYLHFSHCINEAKMYIEAIMTEYYEKSCHYDEAIRAYLQLLMIYLERRTDICCNVQYKLAHHSLPTGKIIQYIYDHSADITLEKLADEFSFNASYLSKMIKGNCHKTFQELVQECRVEKAAFLLATSNLSIETIAQHVGYQNTIPIYKGIKKKYHLTPSAYRNQHAPESRCFPNPSADAVKWNQTN